jgi:large subunit ribosomal protein L18
MKAMTTIKKEKRARRHARIRSTVSGTPESPRLSVFRSNKYIYAQIIDDTTGATLAQAADIQVNAQGTKTERAKNVGTELAKEALAKGITRVVFDRGGFKYTGRVQALADAARAGGLTF